MCKSTTHFFHLHPSASFISKTVQNQALITHSKNTVKMCLNYIWHLSEFLEQHFKPLLCVGCSDFFLKKIEDLCEIKRVILHLPYWLLDLPNSWKAFAAQLSTISVFPVHSELQVTHNIDSTRQILAELAHGMALLACKSNM